MANIIDYIDWRGDITIADSEFNDVDNLILAQMTMINFKGIVPPPFEKGKISVSDAAELYFSDYERATCSLGFIIPPETKDLLRKAGRSRRFGQMKLSGFEGYTNVKEEIQFAALTYEIGDGTYYVSFRGTDDSIIGWKEDFNLSFLSPIPAQKEAKIYLDGIAARCDGNLRIGGHSKGGNLAIYAAVKSELDKDRIIRVYNNDGPGFDRKFLSAPDYEEIEDRVRIILPQSSVVGMLFENKGDFKIVKSNMTGLLQHNPFSWEVLGRSFVELDQLAEDGKRISKMINDWSAKMDIETRKKFVDGMYKILAATDATTLAELNADKYAIVKALRETDPETRNTVINAFRILFAEGGKLFKDAVENALSKKPGEKAPIISVDELRAIEAAFRMVNEGEGHPKRKRNYVNQTAVRKANALRGQRYKVSRQRARTDDNDLIRELAILTRKAVIKRTRR